MSNTLAIASVTRLLKDLLNDALVNGDISSATGSDVVVTTQPPDRALAAVGENQPGLLNLFLHRITPNAAWANADLPTRDGRGGLAARPQLALDLHYLLTAYANPEFHAEILLGYAMLLFHETPVLARGAVRAALQGGISATILPPAFQGDDPARLADQIELIRIVPEPLSLDDMAKLWAAFQTHYRPTVAYQVSVVLIEREQPVRPPLPVLSRGAVDQLTGRDAGVVVQTGITPATPVLTGLAAPGRQAAIRLGETLTIEGHHLDAGDARVRFTRAETGAAIDLAPAAPPLSERILVTLPGGPPLEVGNPLSGSGADPGAWRIGVYTVDVMLTAGGRTRTTNRLPLTLASRGAPVATGAAGGTRIAVFSQPAIRRGQTVSLIVGTEESLLPSPATDLDEVEAIFAGLARGAVLPVRLRVDGIDSPIIDPAARPPAFDPAVLVTVP